MSYWLVPPEWAGETVFILGCGPSLGKAEVDQLFGRRIIAINDAYLLAPAADVLYFCDARWWKENRRDIDERFMGRYIVSMGNLINGVRTLHCGGELGLDDDPGSICHGSNSGFQSINIAYHFGAKRICLLGYDMRAVDGRVHWRARPVREAQPDAQQRVMQNHMLPKFASLAEPLQRAGVEVINCTANSALKLWPYRPLQEILNEPRVHQPSVGAYR